jgi:prephenate dehydratase
VSRRGDCTRGGASARLSALQQRVQSSASAITRFLLIREMSRRLAAFGTGMVAIAVILLCDGGQRKREASNRREYRRTKATHQNLISQLSDDLAAVRYM